MAKTNKLTADKKELIRQLVEILKDFLPYSTPAGVNPSFEKLIKEKSIAKYVKGKNRTQKLQSVWEAIYRYHPRLPFNIIRQIIPDAIDYRKYNRNPLRREELDSLSEVLFELGLDMTNELSKITLNESIPEIKVPPNKLVERLENHPLSEEIRTDPLQKFKDGHYNEAVRKTCERFEVKVQELSGETDIGASLMGKVFNKDNPIIKINDLSTENKINEQDGFQKLSIGIMRGIRNIFSHGDEHQQIAEEAYEMLIFLNWMFRKLENNT